MTTAERALSTWAIDPVHSRLDSSVERRRPSLARKKISYPTDVRVIRVAVWERVPRWSARHATLSAGAALDRGEADMSHSAPIDQVRR